MKLVILRGICLIAIATLSSCSCAIYHEIYSPQGSVKRLNDDLVDKVAQANGFVPRSTNLPQMVFSKKEVDLFYSDQKQTLKLRSFYCPFIPFKLNPQPWKIRCETTTLLIVDAFRKAGVPLKKLTSEERHAKDEQYVAEPFTTRPEL